MKRGIDVSYAQGVIDWAKVAADPQVEFAMIRATATYPHDGKKGVDLKWERNIKGAQANGVPVGVYHYSYALTKEEAVKEAEHFLNTIKGYKLEYPVVFDFEDSTQNNLTPAQMADICVAWLEKVQAAGYYVMLYSMASWLKYKLTDNRLAGYDRWVAHADVTEPMVEGGIWQYTWTGKVGGIQGDVDLNHAYKDYPTIIKAAGLNGWSKQQTTDYKALYLAEKAAKEAAMAKLEKIADILR